MPERVLAALVADLRAALPSGRPIAARDVQRLVADHPACVLVADGRGRVVAASNAALALLGHTPSSLRGVSVIDLAGERETDDIERLWESFSRQRQQSGWFLLRRKDGSTLRTRYAAHANVVADLSVAVHIPSTD